MKKAGIYVRVSSEVQAEKVSPQAQEQDGRAWCASKGYAVIEVYRDIEKYRVGRRLVEPSGTRADRPGLKRMLADVYAGKIDVIIAWREDRLYRSYRPMLDVLDCLDDTGVEIELVKETFDKTFAPVKAWVGKMELDARRDRSTMGMVGRLEGGRVAAGCASVPYGYDYNKKLGTYVVNETEAEWVRRVWRWYGEGVPAYDIRRRLIAAGVPQKGKKPRRYLWHISVVKGMLKRDDYFTGIFRVKWSGQVYEVPIPPIMDAETYQAVRDQQAQWKAYPAGKTRQTDKTGQPVHPVYALAPGLIYCAACNVKMGVVRINNGNGKIYIYYRCNNYHDDCSLEGCARTVRIEKTDQEIWGKVWSLVAKPGALAQALETRIAQLQAQETDAEGACKRLERELEDLFLERQKVVTWARKGFITQEDLKAQLHPLTEQEKTLKRDLADMRLVAGGRAAKLLQLAELYRESVNVGYEAANLEPDTPAREAAQFQARRKIIEGLVTRIAVGQDGSVSVEAEIRLYDDCTIYNKDIAAACNVLDANVFTFALTL